MADEELTDEGKNLKKYFDTDPRFKFVGLIGSGLTGTAFRVRYNDPQNQSLNSFIVKRALDNEYDQDLLRDEEAYLKSLKGAMHIVQVLKIANNPLERPGTKELPALTGHYIIMEYLENGSIENFISNALDSDQRLPNRLLWRFLLCMIKACIAITYHRSINRMQLVSETIPPWGRAYEEGIFHNDMHAGNIMLGDVLVDNEHRITPRLKLIDFGMASRFTLMERIPSIRDITSIGDIMLGLIILDPNPRISREDAWLYQMNANSPRMYTHAIELTPFWAEQGEDGYTWLDPDLRALVCNLMRQDRQNLPSLQDLDNIATHAVHERDAAWYGNIAAEQDQEIWRLWHDIVNFGG